MASLTPPNFPLPLSQEVLPDEVPPDLKLYRLPHMSYMDFLYLPRQVYTVNEKPPVSDLHLSETMHSQVRYSLLCDRHHCKTSRGARIQIPLLQVSHQTLHTLATYLFLGDLTSS